MARPITDTLRLLDEGAFLDRCSAMLAKLVQGVEETGKPGKLQMTLSLKRSAKGALLIQGGGTRLDFVDDNDADTEANMKLFEKFAIGIPVFWAGPGYRIDARLRYRHASGKVAFWYELIRPDRVHEAAAKELIERIRKGLPEGVPLLMGKTAA